MTIDYAITIGQKLSESETKHLENIISQTFSEVNQVYNKYNPKSEISQLNRLNAFERIKISPQLYDLLSLVDQIVVLSKGKFDPTIEPIQQLWRSKLEIQQVPSKEEIEQLAPSVGWNKIQIQDGYFSKDHPDTQLDLGGIAKGLCVDLLVQRINQEGYPNVLVDWGGEMRASGIHPEGRSWRISIRHPQDLSPDKAIAIINLENQAIATSGDYLQFWKNDSKTYFHILDPKTYTPLESKPGKISSASVVAPTCAFADGLATAAMMFEDLEQTKLWAEEIERQFPVSFCLICHESAE